MLTKKQAASAPKPPGVLALNREGRRQRVLVRQNEKYTQICTAGHYAQMMDRCKMWGLVQDGIPMNHGEGFRLLVGSLDAPEFMPAGSMCSDWQRECSRP